MTDFYRPAASEGAKVIPDSVRRGVSFLLALPENHLHQLDEDQDVDAGAVMSWLETGEGDPWKDAD